MWKQDFDSDEFAAVNSHATRFYSDRRCSANSVRSVANKRSRVSRRDGAHTVKPRWRRTEEKVITGEFSRTSRLDEAINAQRGIATPSSAFSRPSSVRAGRNPYYSSIFASPLPSRPRYSSSSPSIRTRLGLKPNFHKELFFSKRAAPASKSAAPEPADEALPTRRTLANAKY